MPFDTSSTSWTAEIQRHLSTKPQGLENAKQKMLDSMQANSFPQRVLEQRTGNILDETDHSPEYYNERNLLQQQMVPQSLSLAHHKDQSILMLFS